MANRSTTVRKAVAQHGATDQTAEEIARRGRRNRATSPALSWIPDGFIIVDNRDHRSFLFPERIAGRTPSLLIRRVWPKWAFGKAKESILRSRVIQVCRVSRPKSSPF